MSPRKKANLGRALGSRQASILEYLWAHGPQSVSELHRGLSAREDLAYTTVFTELSRMLKKGLVAKGNEGGSHLDMRYRAAVTRLLDQNPVDLRVGNYLQSIIQPDVRPGETGSFRVQPAQHPAGAFGVPQVTGTIQRMETGNSNIGRVADVVQPRGGFE